MFIREVVKRNKGYKKAFAYHRLMESVRTPRGPRQRLVLNLGTLDLPSGQWKALANRIEEIVTGQVSFCPPTSEVEELARHYARLLVKKRMNEAKAVKERAGESAGTSPSETAALSDVAWWEEADLNSLSQTRSRTVGGEAIGYFAFRELHFPGILKELGFTASQVELAALLIIGRLLRPASERATALWAKDLSALDELMGADFSRLSNNALYRASDKLFENRNAIEKALASRERALFDLEEKVVLYDLTNTFFEGVMAESEKAKHGRSKEKRSDCPLITLALVVDGEGFPKMSRTYAGGVSEPGTLKKILEDLKTAHGEPPMLFHRRPTIVIDAGIGTDENIKLIKQYHCHYVCVSRSRPGGMEVEDAACLERDSGAKIYLKKFEGDDEVLVYCRSEGRQAKEESMKTLFTTRFEEGLKTLENSIKNPRGRNRYDGIMKRLGRLLEKYSAVGRFYEVKVEKDEETGKAASIAWELKDQKGLEHRYSGAYYVRTDRRDLKAGEIWSLYITLLEVESAFRSLKSELGLRPNFHHKDDRIDGHVFISVLAYHLLAVIRRKLRQNGIHQRWEMVRTLMSSQTRVTSSITTRTNGRIHLRRTVDAEPYQREIYNSLGMKPTPIGPKKVNF